MANKIDLVIKSSIIVILTIVKTSSAAVILPDEFLTSLEQSQNPFLTNDKTDYVNHLSRNKRDAYVAPNDYYSNYYNDYYNNYYNRPSNNQPSRPSADRFDSGEVDLNSNIVTSQGTKYVYVPIFKYKSTQQKRHKLFVPNLFG